MLFRSIKTLTKVESVVSGGSLFYRQAHGRIYEAMKSDLEKRTGLAINRVEVGKIDFLNDTAQVRIYYYADEQTFSDYHVS